MSDHPLDVVSRLERFAHERSGAPALTALDGDLSYGELWSRALALAGRLHEIGVLPGDPVALCVPRSRDLVVAALGILAAGGCYVALDPAYPNDRLSYMIGESGAQVLVAQADTATRLDAVRTVDPAQPVGAAPAACGTLATGDPAYIVFTSGSTGRPKGVLIEHGSLGNLVDWHEKAFETTHSDRCALISSPGFDAAVWEIWSCLALGACLVIPPESVKTDPVALRDWLVEQRITTTFVPTSLCEELLSLDWPATAALRVMLTGGDVLHRRPRADLPFRLVNNYGVSEAGVVSTSGTVVPSGVAGESAELPTLGTAITGVTLSVVDRNGQPVPAGGEGELIIGGVSVGRGYVGHPVHNQGRFFLDAAGCRRYRTGDLVRIGPGGELIHLGRLDEQVNIRGLRIELGEIAAVLDQHPKVRTSAVVAVGHNGSQRLRAFIVGAAGRAPATAELREFLSKRLPEHMIPSDCTMLDELPVNTNGKIDRKALRERGSQIAGRDQLTPPRNDLEEILAGIVAERLWLPAIGIDEDFFALGGHSMLGAQLSVRIGERFGIEVPLRSVFDNPTVAEMAVEVERLLMADIEAMSDDELLEASAVMGFDGTLDEELAG
ncbi:non-ribosomal peptide synthetase [Mycobacterium paraterrae]|uniref:Non-ribosomal peptide synthetase n=1 Tax=Mycobacterium paraterrae TaxID=577492 RepID=A0ABY3VRG7_9MYCO|nr:non-ribosomal peptide synthetase [Mycobacterium paraterrae]UMB70701.1 non-ribosomal peptide synthetase [Mycobacterium paraterrae]